jgi:hypothetical protein
MDLPKKAAGMEWVIGVRVRLKTSFGDEIEGEIFSFDGTTNCVVLTHILFFFFSIVFHFVCFFPFFLVSFFPNSHFVATFLSLTTRGTRFATDDIKKMLPHHQNRFHQRNCVS